MERVIFYIDGFNFYHGLRKNINRDIEWQKCYWIDFIEFFRQFLGVNQSLEKIYYFTAPPPDDDKFYRQRLLFKANTILNGSKFEVIDGKYQGLPYFSIILCSQAYCSFSNNVGLA